MTPSINDFRSMYLQADRCWRTNNFKSCLQICEYLTRALKSDPSMDETCNDSIQLIHLVWFLKIKCLSEDHFVDESLLLNEDDMESDDQVKTITPATRQLTRGTTVYSSTSKAIGEHDRRKMTSGMRMENSRGPLQTGILTGKMPTRSTSRQSGRATSSYRPLTTSLTATQTAFSRSTKPLLRYSNNRYLSKPIYEYLYNAQKVNSRCPDYRQCLEYMNLLPKSTRSLKNFEQKSIAMRPKQADRMRSEVKEAENLQNVDDSSPFWCLSHAICYYNLKMHKLAEEYLKMALILRSKYLEPYLWLIKVYLRQNQPLRVLRACEEGLSNVKSPILYNWKGRVQSLLNQTYAAHLTLRESIRYYPTNIEALANVGYYSFYGDRLELAYKCFERIHQLTSSSASLSGGTDNSTLSNCSEAELFNNLALVNFYSGHYMRVIPLFQRAFLSSPNKEITSTIWYNMSFVPLSVGSRQMAIACLRLALKNDSQNEDAINNLGVLKYEHLINDPLHYGNRQEYWSDAAAKPAKGTELQNRTDQRRQQALFDDAETFFSAPRYEPALESDASDESCSRVDAPVMVYNMAVLKRKRGQLLAASRYCRMYLETDQNNYAIKSMLNEIRELVSHDS